MSSLSLKLGSKVGGVALYKLIDDTDDNAFNVFIVF